MISLVISPSGKTVLQTAQETSHLQRKTKCGDIKWIMDQHVSYLAQSAGSFSSLGFPHSASLLIEEQSTGLGQSIVLSVAINQLCRKGGKLGLIFLHPA